MARGPIEIPIAGDTGPFEKAIRNGVIEPVEDAEKALDKLGKADAGKDIDRDLDKAQDATKDLDKELDKTRKSLDKLGFAAKDVGSGAKVGMGKAEEATGEFKDEALSNFSEVTSSFDGSMESIGELAQGTLGGVAATIPGIGLAAGVAAAGIGAITTAMTDAQERAKEITDGIIADFVELGDALDAEAVASRVNEILKLDETRKEAELLAELLDVSVGQAALAMAGDFEAAGTTVDDVMKAISDAPGDVNYDTWVKLKNTLDATNKGLEYGQQAANASADAMDRKARSDLNAALATGKVTMEVDSLGNELYTLPDGKQIMINADTRKATTDVSNFKGDLDETGRKVVSPVIRPWVDSSAWDNWRPSYKTGYVRGVPQAV